MLSKSSNRNLNLALNATHTFLPGDPDHGSQWTTSAGIQFEERRLFATQILGRTLLTGQESPQQTASQTVTSRIEPVRDLGVFGQEELLLADRRLLLTAGLRADRSSANGSPDKFFFYPKLAASYRFLRRSRDRRVQAARRVRADGQPRAVRLDLPDGHHGHHRGRVRHLHRGPQAGDPNIQPERQEEFEGGFDATFANGRRPVLVLGLPAQHPEPAAAAERGAVHRAGARGCSARTAGCGTEASRRRSPCRRSRAKDVNWVFRTTFFANRSKITRLTVPPSRPAASACRSARSRSRKAPRRPRSSATSGKDANGNAIAGKVGDVTPDFQMSFSSDIDIHRFTLGFLFDWKQGGDIINLTEFLYDAGQTSKDFVGAGPGARPRGAPRGFTDAYVQDGSYLKLREVNLSYNLPDRVTSQSVRQRHPHRAALAHGPQPAAVHALPRARSRGEQLRQPGHRAERGRRAVPA